MLSRSTSPARAERPSCTSTTTTASVRRRGGGRVARPEHRAQPVRHYTADNSRLLGGQQVAEQAEPRRGGHRRRHLRTSHGRRDRQRIPERSTGVCRPVYVVNDAMRRPPTSAEPMALRWARGSLASPRSRISSDVEFLADLGTDGRQPEPVRGQRLRLREPHRAGRTCRWGGVTQPAAIAAQIPSVSDSGSPCMTFAECSADY